MSSSWPSHRSIFHICSLWVKSSLSRHTSTIITKVNHTGFSFNLQPLYLNYRLRPHHHQHLCLLLQIQSKSQVTLDTHYLLSSVFYQRISCSRITSLQRSYVRDGNVQFFRFYLYCKRVFKRMRLIPFLQIIS